MSLSNLHSFFVYVFFGFFLIYPLIIICLKLFNVKHPRQRMGFYIVGLLIPFISFALYYTIFTRRCQTGIYASHPLFNVFDTICWLGTNALRFLGPLMTGMVLLGLLKAVAGVFYLVRLRTTSVEPSEAKRSKVISLVEKRCREWELRTPDILFTDRHHIAAMVMGIYHPVLIINISLLDELTDEELNNLITHELVHIRSGDTVIGWALHLARDLMFFSPFSTLLLKGYMVERERLCDQKTVQTLGSVRSYAGTLLKVWKILLVRQQLITGVTAKFIHSKKDLEYRISSLLSEGTAQKQLPGSLMIVVRVFLIIIIISLLGQIC